MADAELLQNYDQKQLISLKLGLLAKEIEETIAGPKFDKDQLRCLCYLIGSVFSQDLYGIINALEHLVCLIPSLQTWVPTNIAITEQLADLRNNCPPGWVPLVDSLARSVLKSILDITDDVIDKMTSESTQPSRGLEPMNGNEEYEEIEQSREWEQSGTEFNHSLQQQQSMKLDEVNSNTVPVEPLRRIREEKGAWRKTRNKQNEAQGYRRNDCEPTESSNVSVKDPQREHQIAGEGPKQSVTNKSGVNTGRQNQRIMDTVEVHDRSPLLTKAAGQTKKGKEKDSKTMVTSESPRTEHNLQSRRRIDLERSIEKEVEETVVMDGDGKLLRNKRQRQNNQTEHSTGLRIKRIGEMRQRVDKSNNDPTIEARVTLSGRQPQVDKNPPRQIVLRNNREQDHVSEIAIPKFTPPKQKAGQKHTLNTNEDSSSDEELMASLCKRIRGKYVSPRKLPSPSTPSSSDDDVNVSNSSSFNHIDLDLAPSPRQVQNHTKKKRNKELWKDHQLLVNLVNGINTLGEGNWVQILKFEHFPRHFNNNTLRFKWKNLIRYNHVEKEGSKWKLKN